MDLNHHSTYVVHCHWQTWHHFGILPYLCRNKAIYWSDFVDELFIHSSPIVSWHAHHNVFSHNLDNYRWFEVLWTCSNNTSRWILGSMRLVKTRPRAYGCCCRGLMQLNHYLMIATHCHSQTWHHLVVLM